MSPGGLGIGKDYPDFCKQIIGRKTHINCWPAGRLNLGIKKGGAKTAKRSYRSRNRAQTKLETL